MKSVFTVIFFLLVLGVSAQDQNSLYTTKNIAVSANSIFLEKESLNPDFFQVIDKNGNKIDTTAYEINFEKGFLLLKKDIFTTDSLTVNYLKYPKFLTQEYSVYDDSKIVPNSSGQRYTTNTKPQNTFKPFDGLNTSGSI